MPNITIDGKQYDLDELSENAKKQLANLQFVQSEIQKIEANMAVYKTAAASYTAALKNEIES